MLTLEHAQVRDAAAALLARGEPAMVVELQSVQGSVPREAGTRMLVTRDQVIGTIGGGHLEWKSIESARRRLAPEELPGLRADATERYPLGPALGQCCGGVAVVSYQRLDAATLSSWPVTPERFHLQLHGAGHVGRAVAHALQGIPCRVQWIDERDAFTPTALAASKERTAWAEWPPHITPVTTDAAESEVIFAPPGAFYLVMTHRHDLDLRIGEAILRRGDFAWFGLIGSRSKRERFARRWAERGIAPALIDQIACPIGLPGVQGKEPGVIAVSVVAQMLALAQPLATS
jgi:xanthine dehydrogenase accessory factor